MSQERMKALVKEAVNATLRDLHYIDLSWPDKESELDGCDVGVVSDHIAAHLCTLMYGKGGPSDAHP